MPKVKQMKGRITAKQKSARRKNIAVARKAKKKGTKKLTFKKGDSFETGGSVYNIKGTKNKGAVLKIRVATEGVRGIQKYKINASMFRRIKGLKRSNKYH